MANRNDELPRAAERGEFEAYDRTGGEHGEPREYHYGSSFDKPHRGHDPEDVFTQPYDQWNSPRYVFYGGEGYHREFMDPYARGFDPEGGEGGLGWQIARESIRGPFTGRGPKGYVRRDERIWEEVNERLEEDGEIDATDVSVQVDKGEVTLEGKVDNRRAKRLAEDLAESVRGVRDVHNRLRFGTRETAVDVDVQGRPSRSGSGFLTENLEASPATRPRE
ncbi:MAG TPA: BON domain-containing protein [Thermoanaerobaculia bacterium]|jgi:hypothetical protein